MVSQKNTSSPKTSYSVNTTYYSPQKTEWHSVKVFRRKWALSLAWQEVSNYNRHARSHYKMNSLLIYIVYQKPQPTFWTLFILFGCGDEVSLKKNLDNPQLPILCTGKRIELLQFYVLPAKWNWCFWDTLYRLPFILNFNLYCKPYWHDVV